MKRNKLFNPQIVDHELVLKQLIQESSPRRTFLFLVFISSIIATLGLLNEAPELVIGSMLVAPILWPILGISMGIIMTDLKTIKLSIYSLFLAICIAIVTAMIITFFYVPLGGSLEIIRATNFVFMIPVAICAGAAAAFAISYKEIKETVTGVAISVALLPPLVSIGIGIGGTDWGLMEKAVTLFSINLFAISFTAFCIFALLGFRSYRKQASALAKKEEQIIQTG